MNKSLPKWAFGILAACGVVLIASMLVAWIDFGETRSGLSIAWHDDHWLFLVPLAGALLFTTASTRSSATRLAALGAGLVVSGDVLYEFAKGILHSGLDTWLILGGAALILYGIPQTRRSYRLAGGIAVLTGFFAPWTDESMFRMLLHLGGDLGLGVRVLWLIPVAGFGGVISSLESGPRGVKIALASGLVVFGAIGYVLVAVLNVFLGWGAWAAFAASGIALAIAVLARATAPKA